jgi:hypothetical protein
VPVVALVGFTISRTGAQAVVVGGALGGRAEPGDVNFAEKLSNGVPPA